MHDHPAASPRRFYRLTSEGIEAPDEDWSNPQRAVYPEIGEMLIDDYLREKRKERKYRRPTRERFLRPITAGLFIRDYLLGRGPEGSPSIDPDEGDYPEHIFLQYLESKLAKPWAITWKCPKCGFFIDTYNRIDPESIEWLDFDSWEPVDRPKASARHRLKKYK